MGKSSGCQIGQGTVLIMAIVYTDGRSRFFYVVERYQIEQTDWVRYTNSTGEEFTCRKEAFDERFIPMEQ